MQHSITIYEDNDDLRASLSMLIEQSDSLVLAASFSHCVNIVEDTTKYNPQVILLDIDMPMMTGIEGVRRVKDKHPEVEVLMHTVFDDDDNIFEAIANGASGYILKNASNDFIINAVNEVLNGGAPMSPSIARKLLSLHRNKSNKDIFKDLSQRELEVVTELSKGLSYKMAAAKLNISVETVRTHIKKVYEKLHVHSLSEALYKMKMG